MLLFCPTCANILVVEEGQNCYRFACNTCPYIQNIDRKVRYVILCRSRSCITIRQSSVFTKPLKPSEGKGNLFNFTGYYTCVYKSILFRAFQPTMKFTAVWLMLASWDLNGHKACGEGNYPLSLWILWPNQKTAQGTASWKLDIPCLKIGETPS